MRVGMKGRKRDDGKGKADGREKKGRGRDGITGGQFGRGGLGC